MTIVSKDARMGESSVVCGAARGDAHLVAALRDGSDEAFTLLVTEYQTAVYNLAWRLVRDREDARDIAQEVFLKAFRQIPRTTGELRLWAWLYRVTVNTCWDHLRAARRRPILAEDPLEKGDHPSSEGADQADLARVFVASLAQLPPRQQAALLLKDVHGLRHGDIARALGISRGSSEVLLFRARRSFRSAFTAMTADVQVGRVCHFAEQVAGYSVGGRLTEARSRRVLEHAATCPDCRRTVEHWNGTHGVGLGLALPLIAAPELFGAPVAAVAAGSTMVTAGATSALGGLSAKLAGVGITKAAVVALTATAVVTCGGVNVHGDSVRAGGVRVSHAPSVAVVAPSGPAVAAAVADASVASGRSPVASERSRRHAPGEGESRALREQRADSPPGRRLGVGPAARRAAAAGRLRAPGPRAARLTASGHRSRLGGDVRVASAGDSTRVARGTARRVERLTAKPARAPHASVLRSKSGASRPVRKAAGASRPSRVSHKADGAVRQPRAPARDVPQRD